MRLRKDKKADKERRRYPRIHASYVEYTAVKGTDLKKSFTENVCPGGICFLVDEKVRKRTILFLKIYLPVLKYAIEAKGRVVWVRESAFLSVKKRKHYDLGVELIEIEESDREKIWDYVDKYADKK